MPINKDIIIRVIFSFIFFAFTARVLIPVFLGFIKRKLPGQYNHETDIDSMIRRQKERLRAQYGMHNETYHVSTTPEIQKLHQETQWGEGAFLKEIQQEISKNYSYIIAESKVNAFMLLCEKRDYFRFLSNENKTSNAALKNYLVTLLLFFLLIDEIREKNFFIMDKIAKKLGIPSFELALGLQIKLLLAMGSKKEVKEERVFSEILVINQYSEETIKEASESIAKREANLWAKSPSLFFEELTLTLNYSAMIAPIPKLKNRKDYETACKILGVSQELSLEEIKKIYKKTALTKHPDKIVSQKLPKVLERKAIERFNQIQEAYEVIVAHRKI